MNILILSWRDPKHPLAGGAEQVIHEHSKGWIKYGHQITLFSSRFGGSRKKEILDKVKIIRQGSQYLGVQIAAMFFYFKNKNKFDLIIDQFHGIPFFTPFYVNKPKLAIIQEPAKEVWFLNHLKFPLNYLVGLLGYFTEPLLFKFYAKVKFMTGSESVKRELISLGIDRKNIEVINHGIKLIKMNKKYTKEKKPTVIFLGKLAKDKGIEDAIEVFRILNLKDSTFNFWIVGVAETIQYKNRIVELVSKSGLAKKIKFFGHIDDRIKVELLSRAHLLINPSVREGWGLVNIEANLVKTPVVAYNSLGLKDSVKNNYSGLLSFKKTPVHLAEKIIELTKDKKKYERIRKTSILWARKFSWDISIKKSLVLLQKVTNEF